MAGESPDRSKQRESSAEPTPGSASPVPEARGERDPRLAVAREGTAPSGRGGVDTATKVFSIRELREETPETDETASPEAGESTEDPESPAEQNPSAKGDTEGDARLRAAVAAWVTGPKSAGDGGHDSENAENPERAADAGEPVGDTEDAVPEADEAADTENTGEPVADAEKPAGGSEGEGVAAPPAGADTPEDTEAGADDGRDGDSDVTKGGPAADAEPEDAAPEAADAGNAGESVADAERTAGGPEAEGAATRPAAA
ncbi:D-alanyl-D-alanine carboxypeptidase, partial [Streptomyces sp. NPDC051576]